MPYEKILVPTDGSPGAMKAVDEAIDLAEATGATVHALYVVDAGAVSAELDASVLMESFEELGRTAVADVRERASERGFESVQTTVRTGVPHEEIRAYAAAHDVDLIVMGTHGRTGLDRLLLGSVTERIVRTADVPVVTVRFDDEASAQ
jgi:nucleotide-binding universal stress UspA family protein